MGAPAGDDRDLPPTPKFEQGWTIGKPDVVISLPDEVAVPAEGVVPYRYITISPLPPTSPRINGFRQPRFAPAIGPWCIT